MNFKTLQAWYVFGQHLFRSISCSRRSYSAHVEINFVSSLAWEGFGQHSLTCILWARLYGLGLFNTIWDTFYVLDDMDGVWSIHFMNYFVSSLTWLGFDQHKLRYILGPRWHGMGYSQHMKRSIFCPRWHGRLWSTQVEILFVSTLAFEGFVQHMLRWILCPRWHLGVFVNTRWDAFCAHVSIGGVCSTHVEIQFLSSLAYEGFV